MADSAAHEADIRVAIVALLGRDPHIYDALPPLSDICTLLERCYGNDLWISCSVDLRTLVISETLLKCGHVTRHTRQIRITLHQLGTLLMYFENIPSSSVCNFSTSDLEDIMHIIPSFAVTDSSAHITDDRFSGCIDYLKTQSEAMNADLVRLADEGSRLDNRLQKTLEDIKLFASNTTSSSSSSSGGSKSRGSRNLKYLDLLHTGDFDHIFGLLRKDIADSELGVGFSRTAENDDGEMQGVFEGLLEKQLQLYDVFSPEVFDTMKGKYGRGATLAAAAAAAAADEIVIPDAYSVEEKIKAVSESVDACRQSFDTNLREITEVYTAERESKLAALRSMYQRQSASYAECSERASSCWLAELKGQETKADVYNGLLELSLNKFLRESKGIIKEYHDVLQKAQTVVMHRSAEVALKGRSYSDLYETPKTSSKVLKKTKMVDDLTRENKRLLKEEAASSGSNAGGHASADSDGTRGRRVLLEQGVEESLRRNFDLVAIEEAHRLRILEEWA